MDSQIEEELKNVPRCPPKTVSEESPLIYVEHVDSHAQNYQQAYGIESNENSIIWWSGSGVCPIPSA